MIKVDGITVRFEVLGVCCDMHSIAERMHMRGEY